MTDQEFISLPENHPMHGTLVWDTKEKQWYNKKTDIYLSEDDVQYYNLPEMTNGKS